ncbi:MAG: hypothetical protein A2787_09405 [Omnitrophica WOR_2 bacterium RIFCSPHIGHO2_01_FULL_48_9]|nr:MAG: hypothetical protein A3D10_03470 [Omnitrophica WOR_2 bacterium RIFCSPHIGHO2_02_FULL_48_11]OGX30906.1 MAG: hypothetical protein A2787_09405 [Omnitrophica WOR_2 bacterium RIFCSPHIGHO2_01_FULL_48_9]
MKKASLLMFFILFLNGCGDGGIDFPKKLIATEGNFVFIEGHWKKMGESSRYGILPEINAVSITCDRKIMICTENKALLFVPEKQNSLPKRFLYVSKDEYVVTEWTDQLIKAERKAPVADLELRISLIDKSAERSFRETKARGNETANPSVFGHWVLE